MPYKVFINLRIDKGDDEYLLNQTALFFHEMELPFPPYLGLALMDEEATAADGVWWCEPLTYVTWDAKQFNCHIDERKPRVDEGAMKCHGRCFANTPSRPGGQ